MSNRYYVVHTIFGADSDEDARKLVIAHSAELPVRYPGINDAINNARTLSLIDCVQEAIVFQVRETAMGSWRKGGRYEVG